MSPRRPQQARIILSRSGEASTLPYSGIDAGSLVRVRRGVAARRDEWTHLFAEGRLRTLATAVMGGLRNPTAALSHQSAAALHRLPVYRCRSDRVDIIVPAEHSRKDSTDVIRHHMPLPESDVVLIDGHRVTALERTVYDVIRHVRLDAAVVCFDAALHKVAWDSKNRRYDVAAAERFRGQVAARINGGKGARGIRQARFVLEFADGRADSPGESVSRLWMWQLGAPTPDLQHFVDLGGGRYAQLDLAWPKLARWAEFDGVVKYSDPDLLDGRTAEEVLDAERRRQQEIEAVTGWTCDRWGFRQMPSLDAFAAHLRNIGLYR